MCTGRQPYGTRSPWQLLLLPVNHWPRACPLYTYTHKHSCKSPEDQKQVWESHHSVRRLKSDEKCHRRIAPCLPLSWVTAPTHKMHPSFPLSFPFSLSHGGQTISRGNIRCAGEFFSSATDLLYIGVDSHFKDGRREGKKKESLF